MRGVAATHQLRALQVEKLKDPGTYNDGAGLSLVVGTGATKRWELRITVDGKRRQLGLGAYPAVSLEEARRKAVAIREGRDAGAPVLSPTEAARKARIEAQVEAPPTMTLRQAFEAYFKDKEPTLKSEKHAALWRSTLESYAFPALGDQDVAKISTRDVADVLRPIWRDMPETAMRVQQRLKNVFDWAIASDYRTAGNPTLAVKAILGERGGKVQHHRALPHADAPKLVKTLRASSLEAQTRLALEWMLLTVTRQSEARLAEWSELDEKAATWTVPAHRTKMGKDHVVPLPPRCLEILAEAKQWGRKGLIFPGTKQGRPLSENTLNMALKRLGLGEVTIAHGLRSTFRDWATEVAKVREVVAEAALAHAVKDATEAAYRRALYLDERRELMATWAEYCGSEVTQRPASVAA